MSSCKQQLCNPSCNNKTEKTDGSGPMFVLKTLCFIESENSLCFSASVDVLSHFHTNKLQLEKKSPSRPSVRLDPTRHISLST
jgi:hypothetical protein